MGKFLPSTRDNGGNYPPNNTSDPVYARWGEAGFVPKIRRINTGAGLKGGGNLVKDLTLCLNFGETEGTAVEGNDPRLNAARDWSAELISTIEAKAGTSEEARKWSALLVHTAIDGWWEKGGNASKQAKFDSIEKGATKNKSDSHLMDRQFHSGTQSMSTIIGLEEALNGMSSGGGGTGGTGLNGHSRIKTIAMGNKEVYDLVASDVGATLVFESFLDNLEVRMPFCFGNLGDEIYLVAPRTFWSNPANLVKFYSEVSGAKFPPQVATNLAPTFRDGRSIVCLKKISNSGDGMVNWLLFGDLCMDTSGV